MFLNSGRVMVEVQPDGKTRRLVKRIVWVDQYADRADGYDAGAKLAVIVPEEFETDFASTPRILWPIFPPTGKYTAAAVVHDYLYRRGAVQRVVADAVFLAAMKELGVARWRRGIMYAAVRLFGWLSYRPNKQV